MQARRRVRVELTTPADEIATRTTEVDTALTPLATPMERDWERPNFQNSSGIACGLLAATAAMPLFPSAVITTANPRAGEWGDIRNASWSCARSIVPRMPRVRSGARHRRNRRQSPGAPVLSTADDGSMPLVSFSAAQHSWRGATGTGATPRPRSLRWRACVASMSSRPG